MASTSCPASCLDGDGQAQAVVADRKGAADDAPGERPRHRLMRRVRLRPGSARPRPASCPCRRSCGGRPSGPGTSVHRRCRGAVQQFDAVVLQRAQPLVAERDGDSLRVDGRSEQGQPEGGQKEAPPPPIPGEPERSTAFGNGCQHEWNSAMTSMVPRMFWLKASNSSAGIQYS